MSPYQFEWQDGYACFSANASGYGRLVEYIKNQEEHHSRRTLKEEIKIYLDKAGIPYDDKYIFTD